MANKTVNIDVQVQTKSLQDLETELEQINAQLKEVPIGSQAFQELSTQAQQVTKELDGVNRQVEGFTLERKVRASQGAVTALAGGLEATVGSLGLIGVESEVFGEFEEKALSAIAAGRGFIDIADGAAIMAENINLATIKSKIFGITTKQALIATGIGAFVVVLGTIIANWEKINAGVQDFIQKTPLLSDVVNTVKEGFDNLVNAFRPVLEFLNILPDEVERANTAAIESNDELITSLEREIAIAQASGATAEEVYNLKLQLANAELDNLKRNNEEKEEIYKKETEILVLEEEERTRVKIEEEEKRTQEAEEQAKERTETVKEENDKIVEDARQTQQEILNLEAEASRERTQSAVEAARSLYQELQLTGAEAVLELAESQGILLLGADKALLDAQEQQLIISYNKRVAETQKYYEDLVKESVDGEATAVKALEDQLFNREISLEEFFTRRDELERLYYNEQLAILGTGSDALYSLEQIFLNDLGILREESAQAQIERNNRVAESARDSANENNRYLREAIEGTDTFIEILYGEHKIRKTLAQANTIDRATELANEAKAALTRIALTKTEGAVDASAGFVKTAKAGFPQNIPLLLAYGAQIAALIASLNQASNQARSTISGLSGVGGGGGSISTPSGISGAPIPQSTEVLPPQETIVTPITKTYVLTGDVTTGQEAEAKLNTKRTI